MKKVYIETMGCQMNKSDSERMFGMLSHFGYEQTENAKEADLVMVNTCSIRQLSEDKAFSLIGVWGQWKKTINPDLKIGFCGCVAQQKMKEVFRRAPYVDFVLGTHKIYSLPDIIKRINEGERVMECEETHKSEDDKASQYTINRVKSVNAWIPITEGCNNFCTYCIVPYVRGRERSRRKEEIISEVQGLVNQGYKDITLLGQNVNSYGKDLDVDYDFADLLEELAHIEGDFLLHFMTSHPKDATKKLVDVIANNKNIAKQFHLPLQSGSDSILQKMNRHYQMDRYLEIVDYMKEKIPDIVISSDIIVGFPGETEEDFEGTLEALRQVRFDMIYSFIYSPRKGTPAAEMDEQIPSTVQSERFNRLLNLQNGIAFEINQKHLGETIRVLCDGPSKNNPEKMCGRTEGNKIVLFDGSADNTGKYLNIKITKCETFALLGEIVD